MRAAAAVVARPVAAASPLPGHSLPFAVASVALPLIGAAFVPALVGFRSQGCSLRPALQLGRVRILRPGLHIGHPLLADVLQVVLGHSFCSEVLVPWWLPSW